MASAQTGGDDSGRKGGEGGESTTRDENAVPVDNELILEEDVGDSSAEVASRQATAYSLAEDGTTEVAWTPPGWLATCETDEVTFAQLKAERSATAAYYTTVYSGAFVEDNAEWVVLGCTGVGAQVLLGGGVPGSTQVWSGVAYPVGGDVPWAVIRWLIADALAQVQVPVQAGSSAPNGEDAPVLYQLETVVWVDPGIWQPTSGSSSLPGADVTVTAEPISARFEALPNNPDDPDGSVDCGATATEPWTPARDEALIEQGCTITFKQAADSHVLRSEVVWSFSWVCAQGCGSGDFGGRTITRVNDRPVDVVEYLVVES